MNTKIISKFLCVVSLCLLSAGTVYGEDRGRYWDFGIGSGINFDGNPTRQLLLIPAYSARMSWSRALWYRIEGNLELIEGQHKLTAVPGVATLARWYMKESGLSPFVEIGAGANLVTRNHTANKESGGFFLFSPMAGAGLELRHNERPVSVSCRLRHLSNAHIFPINQSMNTLYFIVSIGM